MLLIDEFTILLTILNKKCWGRSRRLSNTPEEKVETFVQGEVLWAIEKLILAKSETQSNLSFMVKCLS